MRKIFLLLSVALFVAVTSTTVHAQTEEIITDSDYYTDSVLTSVDDDVIKALDEIGLDSFSIDDIFSVSFERIGSYFSKTVSEKLKSCLSDITYLLIVVVILISVKAYFITDRNRYISLLGVSAIVITAVNILESVINMLINTLSASGSFIHSYVPVYTLLLSLGGNVSSALTYNTVTFVYAQLITLFAENGAVPLLGAYLSLSVAFSVNSVTNLNRFISIVNKAVNTVVGFVSSTFAALLTVRGAFSASVDTVSAKSIRFLIGNLIPIVGSSISDAYSTLLGSINVIKGSVAAIGIIVIILIVVPPVIEAVLYSISFSLISYFCEMAELNDIASVLKALSSSIKLLVMLNILLMFILIISTAIMLSAKGGV